MSTPRKPRKPGASTKTDTLGREYVVDENGVRNIENNKSHPHIYAEKKRTWLERTRGGATQKEAADAIDVSVSTVLQWARKDAAFAMDKVEAEAVGALEIEDFHAKKCLEGYLEPQFHNGRPVMWINPETGALEHYCKRTFDPRIIELVLKGRYRQRYDNTLSVEVFRAILEKLQQGSEEDTAILAKLQERMQAISDKIASQAKDDETPPDDA